ncbi:MAG: hypothetical protein AUJ92_00950 [Armatimonadetes bacterium CG2_30_59_28]|nr:copper transporter [Armatimonadota bacterium]OIO98669.1 MAG: hypothetical protein AUJ92_00950 [Armatimonadetes bacterium CG2_30_59_28]PIU61012.1 MAG: hypothetical protein COS85_22050 [Armatimonadetes bacterium CG07_land_8_20_14_0_80_59_28]PIX41007.1 MAG: hypothetical protein COZ56_13205 [Armatimonadetes bacterium CG_4_8_14_3_um_filter_58_9]PJB62113.1 MAG: hypothetical protein CO095_19230 [Armatimonadetes bacterium CG_4_9_14_3_um_filter_58_7]
MGTDTRYLVITIGAVFIAIALGILLGIGITDQPSLDKLASQFEKEFEEVRSENKSLREEREYYDETNRDSQRLLKILMPSLVERALAGRKVAVLETGLLDDATLIEDIRSMVNAAGGQAVSVTRFSPDFVGMSSRSLIDLQKKLQLEDLGTEITSRHAAEALGRQIATGQIASVLRGVARTKAVEVSGEYRFPVDAFVLVGGYEMDEAENPDSVAESITARQKTVDFPLIESLQSLNSLVVGVEPAQVGISYMDAYQKHGISTVDNVDSQVGLLSLVYALSGRAGHYGTKNSAERLMPELGIPRWR